MPAFNLHDIREACKPHKFPEPLIEITPSDLEDVQYFIPRGSYFDVESVKCLPGGDVLSFSSLRELGYDSQYIVLDDKVVGDCLTITTYSLNNAEAYKTISKVNSLLQSLKTLLSLMGLHDRIFTSSFRRTEGKGWFNEYKFAIAHQAISHEVAFNYTRRKKSEGQDGGQAGGDEGGEGEEKMGDAPPM